LPNFGQLLPHWTFTKEGEATITNGIREYGGKKPDPVSSLSPISNLGFIVVDEDTMIVTNL